MKQLFFILILVVTCFTPSLIGQEDCGKIFERAQNAFLNADDQNFQLALNKLEAVKRCAKNDPKLIQKADSLIIVIFEKIKAQRDTANVLRYKEQRARAEAEKLLGEKYLAQARIALSKNDFENTVRNIDESLKINESEEAQLLIAQLLNKIPPTKLDKMSSIVDLALFPKNDKIIAYIGYKNNAMAQRTLRVFNMNTSSFFERDGIFMTTNFSPDGRFLYVAEQLRFELKSGSGIDAEYEHQVGIIKFSTDLNPIDTIFIQSIPQKKQLNFRGGSDTTFFDAKEYLEIEFTPDEKTMVLSGYAAKQYMRAISNPTSFHLRTWIELENGSVSHNIGTEELSSFHHYAALGGILNDSIIVRDGTSEVFLINLNDKSVLEIGKHSDEIQDLAVSPDKDRIACVGENNKVTILTNENYVWKTEVFEISSGTICEKVIFTKNDEIAIARTDNIITLVSLKPQEIIEQQNLVLDGNIELRYSRFTDLVGHRSEINHLSISSNRKWLISSAEDNSTRLWSLLESKKVELNGSQRGVIKSYMVSSNNSLFSVSRDGFLFNYDFSESSTFNRSNNPYNPKREKEMTDKVWDEGGGLTKSIIREEVGFCRDIIWDEIEHKFYTINYGGGAVSWDWDGFISPVNEIAENRIDSILGLHYIDRRNNAWAEIDEHSQLQLHVYDGKIDSSKVAYGKFSPSGRLFVYFDKNKNELLIWKTDKTQWPFAVYKLVNTSISNLAELKFSKNEKIFAFPCFYNGDAIGVVDIEKDKTVVFEQDITGYSFDLSPSGNAIAVAGRMGEVYYYSTAKKKLTVLGKHSRYVTSVAFSPNGKWIASGSRDRTVRLWSIDLENPDYEIFSYTNPVEKVVFGPTGEQLLSVSGTGIHSVYTAGDATIKNYKNASFRKSYLDRKKYGENSQNYEGELGLIPTNSRATNRKKYIENILGKKISINSTNREKLVQIILSNSTTSDQKIRAIYELSTHGEILLQSIDKIISALRIDDFSFTPIQELIIQELFTNTGKDTESSLISFYNKLNDKWTKVGLLQALVKLFPSSASTNKLLKQTLADLDSDVQLISALNVNGEDGNQVVLNLLAEAIYNGHEIRELAANVLMEKGVDAVPLLIHCLESDVQKHWKNPRELAQEALVNLGAKCEKILLDSLYAKNENYDLKAELVYILNKISTPSPNLLKLCVDFIEQFKNKKGAESFVAALVRYLQKFGVAAEVAMPQLIYIFENTEDFSLNYAVAKTLESIGLNCIGTLIVRLPQVDQLMRSEYYEILKKFGSQSKDALHYVIIDLDNCTGFDCSEAIELIGALGVDAGAALPILFEKLKSEEELIEDEIITAIGKIGQRNSESIEAIMSKMFKVVNSGRLIEFKSTDAAIDELRMIGVPENILAEVVELNDMPRKQEYFANILYRDIGHENFQKYGDLILKRCRYDVPHFCDDYLVFSKGCEAINAFNYYSPDVEKGLRNLKQITSACSNIQLMISETLDKIIKIKNTTTFDK